MDSTGRSLTVTAATTLAELGALPSGSFLDITCTSLPSEDVQEQLFRLLHSNAKLCIRNISTREEGNVLTNDLKIQGFDRVMVAKDAATVGESGGPEGRFLVCQKPELVIGASARITLPPAAAKPAVTAAKWTMESGDLADADLIDENALLDDDDDLTAPSREEKEAGGCGVPASGPKRACKDCSCGLAEQEAAGIQGERAKLTPEQIEVKASSCGGCYKGDAFRCGSCPFLGKPAFEPGQEKVVLSMTDDL